MCTFIFVFPGIFLLRGIGQGLSLDRAVFPVYISQPMFILVLVPVLGVSVLDVLEYLIAENAKYLYLITST